MTYKRLAHLASGNVQSSDDATYILELPRGPILHSLLLKVEVLNGPDPVKGLHIKDIVKQVEVIANGSERIVSLSAEDLERWGMLYLGHAVPATRIESADEKQSLVLPICFGRTLVDDNFYLPTNKFSDLELHVRYTTGVNFGQSVPGTTTFTVMAYLTIDGDPKNYVGTIKTTNVSHFVTASSGDKEVDLPRGLPYYRLMVSAYAPDLPWNSAITNVRFDTNNLEQTYIDANWDDLQEINQIQFNLWPEFHARISRYHDERVYCGLSNIQHVSLASVTTFNFSTKTFNVDHPFVQNTDEIIINAALANLTASASDLAQSLNEHGMYLRVLGKGLPYAVVLDFDSMIGGKLLNSANFDRTRLTLTQGYADATARVSLQEIKTFA